MGNTCGKACQFYEVMDIGVDTWWSGYKTL